MSLHMGSGICVQEKGRCVCRRILVHEAGHVVACWSVGARVLLVDQRQHRRSHARRANAYACVLHEAASAHDLATISAAGPIAEQLASIGFKIGDHVLLVDFEAAQLPEIRELDRFPDEEADAIFAKAQHIVASRWREIEAIADALHHHPLIHGAALRDIVATTVPT